MISKLSNIITRNLLNKNIISDEEKELYEYGLFMIISHLIFFLISILFGIALNIPFSSMLFFISFCLVRNFSGGIHANSEIKCDIITTISILISEITIKIFIDYSLVSIAFVMLIISSFCLSVIKPVSTSQKEINEQEKKHFHKKVIILTVSFLMISIIAIVLKFYSITISFSIGLSLANILLVLGKLQQTLTNKFVPSEPK